MAEQPIPIEEDMRFQRATWKIERAGWVVLALIVIAALLGVFSNGYLSSAAKGDEHGFNVHYDRFQRRTVTTHLRMNVPADDDNVARLRVGRSVLDDYEIDAIDPRPSRAAADQTDLVFDFDTGDTRELAMVIALRPRRIGMAHLSLAAANRPPLMLRTFVYP
jgi:hypothetical protein